MSKKVPTMIVRDVLYCILVAFSTMATGRTCTLSTSRSARLRGEACCATLPSKSRTGRIVAISSSTGSRRRFGRSSPHKVIDGRGLYLQPGLIDSHVI